MTLWDRVERWSALLEKATPRPWSTNSRYKPQASAKVLVGSDMRTIAYIGMNPGTKEWETYAQDITNAQLIVAAVNEFSELEADLRELRALAESWPHDQRRANEQKGDMRWVCRERCHRCALEARLARPPS